MLENELIIMRNVFEVRLSDSVIKDLKKLPPYIVRKLQLWVLAVSEFGLIEVSKIKGYHDEPLKGDRIGQRSIRLNKSYRAIYQINDSMGIEFIYIYEVNKHEY